jgi:hypothetical protein
MHRLRLMFCVGLCMLASCGDSTDATGGAGGVGGTSGTGGSGGIDFDVWPCTEQGIRDAITFGGGPHTFACDGPTVVTTQATIDIDNDVILDGDGNLTVDGNRSHGVFRVQPTIRAELRRVTVARGRTVFDMSSTAGAGIHNQGDLRIDGCSVVENESNGIAGGIYSSEGSLEIANSVISKNEGGGISAGGDVLIEDSSISENLGPGILNFGRLTIWRTTIADNETEFSGGGIYNSGDLQLASSTVSGNTAGRGGGIYNVGYLWVFQTAIDGNTADEGSGIYGSDALRFEGDLSLSSLGLIEVQNSTISNNTADRGAGIHSISLRMTVWNSTFSGNVASEEGGALYIGGTTLGASTTYLTMSTIANNTAPLGSAVLGAGETPTVRFSGTIVDGDCHGTDAAVVWMSQGSNIESPGDSCDFGQGSDMVNVTNGQLRLDVLADNGGETETHLPMMGSVVIDAIPAEQCSEVLPASPLLDQRVVSRPQGIGCDVGSVEVVSAP